MSERLTDEEREALVGRITEYLVVGGLFNPEAVVPQVAVRDLLMDCRDALSHLAARAGDREEREEAHRIERLRYALRRVADGATGYLDRDTTLAGWARKALHEDDIRDESRAAPGGETRKEGLDG